jgi:hypothetical protein
MEGVLPATATDLNKPPALLLLLPLTGSPAFLKRFISFSGKNTPGPIASHAYDAATAWMKAYKAAPQPRNSLQVIAPLGKVAFDGETGTGRAR